MALIVAGILVWILGQGLVAYESNRCPLGLMIPAGSPPCSLTVPGTTIRFDTLGLALGLPALPVLFLGGFLGWYWRPPATKPAVLGGKMWVLALGLFALAWIAVGLSAALSMWESTASLFLVLLLLSGVAYGVGLFNRWVRPGVRGKILTAAFVIALMFLFLAPAVQTSPTATGQASECNRAGCAVTFQYESATEATWCWGASYQYTPPPVADFMLRVDMGCPFLVE